MTEDGAPSWARSFLREIARPRLPGSDGVREVEARVAARLRDLGLDVRRQEFTTSARRLHAVSVGAAGAGWTALLAMPLFILDVPAWVASLVVVAALGAVGVVAHGLAAGHLPLAVPAVSAVNLVATRSERPRWWLVAHLDSKAQGVSLRGRILAGAALAVGIGGLVAAAAVHLVTPVGWFALPWVVIATLGAAAMSLHPVRPEAPGAVDNASGILAVLAAAETLRDCPGAGVLVTGAEEFGMEGARHWLGTGGSGDGFVNFDGLDDRGGFNLMPHRPGRGGRAVTDRLEESLARALAGGGGGGGGTVRRSRLPLGVFVDGGVLVSGGLPGVTVSHGDWATLGVIHTAADSADRLTGDAAWRAGRIAGGVVRHRLVDSPSGEP